MTAINVCRIARIFAWKNCETPFVSPALGMLEGDLEPADRIEHCTEAVGAPDHHSETRKVVGVCITVLITSSATVEVVWKSGFYIVSKIHQIVSA